jgi:hypothetical protein
MAPIDRIFSLWSCSYTCSGPVPILLLLLLLFLSLLCRPPVPLSMLIPSIGSFRSRPDPGFSGNSPLVEGPKFLAPRVSLSRLRGSFTTEFKLGVLRWWEHGAVQMPCGGSRQPNRTEVALRYGIKHPNYLNRWLKVQLALASLFIVLCSSS